MAIDQVALVSGQGFEIGDQIHIDPGMDTDSDLVGTIDSQGQRIEISRLAGELFRSRFEIG